MSATPPARMNTWLGQTSVIPGRDRTGMARDSALLSGTDSGDGQRTLRHFGSVLKAREPSLLGGRRPQAARPRHRYSVAGGAAQDSPSDSVQLSRLALLDVFLHRAAHSVGQAHPRGHPLVPLPRSCSPDGLARGQGHLNVRRGNVRRGSGAQRVPGATRPASAGTVAGKTRSASWANAVARRDPCR